MQRPWIVLWVVVLCVTLGFASRAQATDDRLIRLLLQKGILTQEEYEAFKAEAEKLPPAPPAAAPTPVPAPGSAAAPTPAAAPGPTVQEAVDRLRDEVRAELRRKDAESLTFALLLEGEARYRSHRSIGDRTSGGSFELYVRTAQLDVEAKPLDWVVAHLTVKSEYVGAETDNQGQPADETPFIDTAIITLKRDTVPLYGVVGKRTQPYGAFLGDGRFATEPMSKNAYEVNEPGATVGFATPRFLNLDASLTLYAKESQVDHLFESGLFDVTSLQRSSAVGLRDTPDTPISYIAAVTLEPMKDLTIGAAFVSEPGDDTRNQTIGAWVSYTLHTPVGALIADAELHAALDRERYVLESVPGDPTTAVRLDRAFKERVLVLGLTYQPLSTLDVGVRYEQFWDDGLADAAGVWAVRYRISGGVAYTLYQKDEIAVRLIGEYRLTEVRRGGAARETAAPSQHEVFGKIAVSYR